VNLILLLVYLLKILKTVFSKFYDIAITTSKMFFLAFLSLSILFSVFYIMFYVHILSLHAH